MYNFSKRSIDNLNTCDDRLQEIAHEAIKIFDFSVLCGHRNEQEQTEAFESGASNAKWGESPHNLVPSRAIDVAPYPLDWWDTESFAQLAGIFKAIAYSKGIAIKWGGDFQNIKDMPHFELV